jgi:hypothetical protein
MDTRVLTGAAVSFAITLGAASAPWHAWQWLQAGLIIVFGVCAVSAWREPRPPRRNVL